MFLPKTLIFNITSNHRKQLISRNTICSLQNNSKNCLRFESIFCRIIHYQSLSCPSHQLKQFQFDSNVKCALTFGILTKNAGSVSIQQSCSKSFNLQEKRRNMVKVLNVAEKNDAAKNLASILSRGGSTRREGLSPFNKIYEFPYQLNGQQVQMVFTSVSGHLLNHEFVGNYKRWHSCSPLSLFDAPVAKGVKEESMEKIKRTLEREVRGASKLIIWTDCDREGENIGFEVISVCRAVKPNIPVLRARFSEITQTSVNRAIATLCQPDELQSKAVDVRSELDLRIGAAFTRFQTLRLQKVFPASLADTLISYGSCQFPTLGFVVQRYKSIQEFIPENFWKIKATHHHTDGTVEFTWCRVRVFNELCCDVLMDTCLDDPTATVTSINARPRNKWRPLPLDTIEFEKLASRKLRMSAKDAMKVAERLYTSGVISYPRTETNIFPKEINLASLVEMQTEQPQWGEFASRVLAGRGPVPRQGKKTDEAHPPIHPTKSAPHLSGEDQRVYELITRSFLACVSDDARAHETVVEIAIAGEKFRASGLIILEKNYLEVYPYDKWTDKPMPQYEMGARLDVQLEKVGGETSPPSLLTEADLIALMEKHGIGTDATHADHIETIKARSYVGLQDTRFVPGTLGMGLVNGYDDMGFQMSRPHLRAGLEEDLKAICEGRRDAAVVLQEQIQKYKEVFVEATQQATKLDEALAALLDEAPTAPVLPPVFLRDFQQVCKCGECGDGAVVKQKKNNGGFFLSCLGFPECRVCRWLPDSVVAVDVLPEKCQSCPGAPSLLRLTLKPRSFAPLLPDVVTTCVLGCDRHVLDTIGVRPMPIYLPPNAATGTQRGAARPPSTRGRGAPTPATRGGLVASRGRGVVAAQRGPAPLVPASSRGAAGRAAATGSRGNSARNSAAPVSNSAAVNSGNWDDQEQWGNVDFSDDLWDLDEAELEALGAPAAPVLPRGGAGRGRGASTSGHSSGFVSLPASSRSASQRDRDDTSDPANRIVCECSEDAILLTVRKEGPNTGRQFYKCSKPMGAGCNFFLWADDGPGGASGGASRGEGSSYSTSGYSSNFNGSTSWSASQSRNNSSTVAAGADGNEVLCGCGLPSIMRTVQKEGPNRGRQFYVCKKSREEQCNFFQWADENDGDTPQRSAPQRGRGRGRGAALRGAPRRAPAAADGSAAPKKRKCGVCGEEGHNRKNCPSNNY